MTSSNTFQFLVRLFYSLVNLVFAALTENATAGALQERLLAILGVRDLLSELLGLAGHRRFLIGVGSVLTYHDSLRGEVQRDVIEVLVLVETDLDSASSSADALHVVLVESDGDDVPGTRHFLNSDLVDGSWQVLKLKINDTNFIGLFHRVVSVKTGLSSDRAVACEHSLLGGLGLTALDGEGSWSLLLGVLRSGRSANGSVES